MQTRAAQLSGLAAGTRDKANDVFNTLEREINPRYLRDLTEARLSHFATAMRTRGNDDVVRLLGGVGDGGHAASRMTSRYARQARE